MVRHTGSAEPTSSAAQRNALQHFWHNFSQYPAGRNPVSDLFSSTPCWTLTSCLGNLCVVSHILQFSSNGQILGPHFETRGFGVRCPQSLFAVVSLNIICLAGVISTNTALQRGVDETKDI